MLILLGIALMALGAASAGPAPTPAAQHGGVAVYFSMIRNKAKHRLGVAVRAR
jgi:hypothetical protein